MENKNEQNINISNSQNFSLGNISANINSSSSEENMEKEATGLDKQALKQLLISNQLQELIDQLLLHLKREDLRDQAILLNSRLNQLNTEIRLNTLSFANQQLESNRIKQGLLSLIDLI